ELFLPLMNPKAREAAKPPPTSLPSSRTLEKHRAALLKHLTSCVPLCKLPAEEQRKQLDQLGKGDRDLPRLAGVPPLALPTRARAYHRGQAQLRCAIVMVALERYRLAHTRWPDSLAALVPKFLPKVPLDPYDGQPLRYRKRKD